MSNLNDIRVKLTPFTIGKDIYNLHFDMNAFAELEEIYGSVETALNKVGVGSIKVFRTFLWAGLIHENKELTQEDVGKMFDLSETVELKKLINEAIKNGLPDLKENPSKKEQSQAKKK